LRWGNAGRKYHVDLGITIEKAHGGGPTLWGTILKEKRGIARKLLRTERWTGTTGSLVGSHKKAKTKGWT